MSSSATIIPTTPGYSDEELTTILVVMLAIAVAGIIYLCVQCCICVSKSRPLSSSGDNPPTIEDNRDDQSSSSTTTQSESSNDYC